MVKKHIKNNNYIWQIGTFLFAVLFLVSIFTNIFDFDMETKVTEMTVKVLTDERCEECAGFIAQVSTQLQILFPNMEVEEIDYSSKEGSQLYEDLNLQALPAFLFDENAKDSEGYAEIKNYMVPSGEYLSLQIGAQFNPNAEICNNEIDDTGDGLIDCEADECKGLWDCVEKTDKPVVELFIMSHCPYGTQIEKGIIPAVKTLGDKIDFQLKYVNYAMHGEKEIKEQLNQYCIEKEYSKDDLISYLECFLIDDDGEGCLVDYDVEACVAETDEEFGIMKDFADKTTWKGNFPSFNLHNADNLKYSVGGSPTLIINGAKPNAGRDSASLLAAMCYAFSEAPEECDVELSSESPAPGFGYDTVATGATDAGCSV